MTQPNSITGSGPVSNDPGTEYTILSSLDGATFQVAGTATARDANSAIKQHLEGMENVDQTFVAVPARSWRPVKVKTRIVILSSLDGATFQVAGTATARDANSAIKQHLEGMENVDQTFVAVPARSWRPVKVKTRIALDFGDPA